MRMHLFKLLKGHGRDNQTPLIGQLKVQQVLFNYQ